MANPHRAEKKITLGFGDDVELVTLAFDPGTVADLEMRLKLSVPEISALLDENRIGFNFIFQGIAAGLQRYHRGRTAAWVSQNFDPERVKEYILAIFFCFGVACGGDPAAIQAQLDAAEAEAETDTDEEKDVPSGEGAAEEGSETGPAGLSSSSKPSSSESTPSPSGT